MSPTLNGNLSWAGMATCYCTRSLADTLGKDKRWFTTRKRSPRRACTTQLETRSLATPENLRPAAGPVVCRVASIAAPHGRWCPRPVKCSRERCRDRAGFPGGGFQDLRAGYAERREPSRLRRCTRRSGAARQRKYHPRLPCDRAVPPVRCAQSEAGEHSLSARSTFVRGTTQTAARAHRPATRPFPRPLPQYPRSDGGTCSPDHSTSQPRSLHQRRREAEIAVDSFEEDRPSESRPR